MPLSEFVSLQVQLDLLAQCGNDRTTVPDLIAEMSGAVYKRLGNDAVDYWMHNGRELCSFSEPLSTLVGSMPVVLLRFLDRNDWLGRQFE